MTAAPFCLNNSAPKNRSARSPTELVCHNDCNVVLDVGGLSGLVAICNDEWRALSSTTVSLPAAIALASATTIVPAANPLVTSTGTLATVPPCGPICGNAGTPAALSVAHAFAVALSTSIYSRDNASVAIAAKAVFMSVQAFAAVEPADGVGVRPAVISWMNTASV